MSDTTAKMLITAWFSDDDESRGKYLQASEPILRQHGYTRATLYGSQATVQGDFAPDAIVMLEWESAEAAQRAFDSPEYQALLELRGKGFTQFNCTLLAE